MNYYYLIASLPVLQFSEKPGISYEEFRTACGEQLSHSDLDKVEQIERLHRHPGELNREQARSRFVGEWAELEIEIRNILARQRAGMLNREYRPLKQTRGTDPVLEKSVSEAMSKKNPLEKEKALDLLRWNIVEELKGLDAFSVQEVLSYAVRLLIAERWAGFDTEKGKERLEKIVNSHMPARPEPDEEENPA
jgi:hypothetical protein